MSEARCIIITIGEEIVSGLVTDTNSAYLARHLYALGMEVHEIRSIKDDQHDIVSALHDAYKKCPFVILTGGLGPTRDDVTKKALIDFFQCEEVFDERTWNRIEKLLAKYGRKPTDASKNQAFMPSAAQILLNDMGTAPGMWFDQNNMVLLSMPGVPYEMKHLYTDRAMPLIRERFTLQPVLHKIIMTSGVGETIIAKEIEDVENHLPQGISIAYLPGIASVRVRISGRGSDVQQIQEKMAITQMAIEERIEEHIFGYDGIPLAQAVGEMLEAKGKWISTAESCTGGRIAHDFTKNSGSSAYFAGGVVTYSNALKMKLLGVKQETLKKHGAVSEEVVIEMAQGAIDRLNTDFSIAVSGIAGPGGGTVEKPVGTIWIACGSKDMVVTQKLNLSKDRHRNIDYTTMAALTLMRKFIIESEL